ncbi:hypothetical protein SAMN04488523_1287 [Sulfitobacter brevis]|jgi:hypothetical protein|uniref:Uncharacterized protein n=1 Tax=Sulfitobacter brevis TaxID=74348 RepID=A0A1I2GSI5_9RHOB|nr:hypothetical protein SAMN04488523_1287 [Sulfitobacter brevis]
MGAAYASLGSQGLLAQPMIVAYVFDIMGNSVTYLHDVERATK